ncbi:hypothetical protein [Arthrobacter sp. 2MCAF14]|uniref:hypothetical protein n=1 Tax=Arthrobacter sp. 2MCAF14 TaxID=3232982 RepID=UPI003F9371CB
MISHFPKDANSSTGVSGVSILRDKLQSHDVVSFVWPQEVDRGIDLVAFAVSKDGTNDGVHTAFLGAFQCKASGNDQKKRTVPVDQHHGYWSSATPPVFVANVDTSTKEVLVEDAQSFLAADKTAAKNQTSVRTTVTLEDAMPDIRLRMYAQALAPWASRHLRSRTLAHRDSSNGLDPKSTWSLIAYAGTAFRPGEPSDGMTPGNWYECSQYFTLIDSLYHDQKCRDQLLAGFPSNKAAESQHEGASSFKFLLHLLDVYTAFGELHMSMPDREAAKIDLDRAVLIIPRIWNDSVDSTLCSSSKLASRILSIGKLKRARGRNRPRDVNYLLTALADGQPMEDALRQLIEPWWDAGHSFVDPNWSSSCSQV